MTQKVLTVSQARVEEFINEHEDFGEMLAALGLITTEELEKGVAADEKFRLKIEADEALAEASAEELAQGASLQDVERAAGVEINEG